jgi:aromatic-amino-acid transaminase
MTASIFADVELAPRDPILGLNEAFIADTRANKVNLGVGVYYDDNGKIPLLAAVRQAEEARVATHLPRGYQPIEGAAAYNTAVQDMLFGEGSTLAGEKRLITAQALGGTGALKIGADLLHRLNPHATVYISDPSWENHRALFEAAGFGVATYSYFDSATRGVDFPAMRSTLDRLSPGSIVVLHACCHNPTGADLDSAQWNEVVQRCKAGGLIPFLDMAYQGFADGIDEDAVAVRAFAAAGMQFFISNSFSKNFSLYGERVGALTIVTADADESARMLSQLKRVIRTNYSNPPTHGGAMVATVLATPVLRAAWEAELGEMRSRIRSVREQLVHKLADAGVKHDFGFIIAQRGMFSYTGLSTAQVERLREAFGIYAVGTGRICLAALNTKNIDAVAHAIAAVL